MNNKAIPLLAVGALLTAAIFVASHFLYDAGNHQAGYVAGVLAFAPFAGAALVAWQVFKQRWAKTLFGAIVAFWVATVLFSLM
jgi:hypothetical protein